MVMVELWFFVPVGLFDGGLQEGHASHVRSLGYFTISEDRQHLLSKGRLQLRVAGQLVQRPGQGAGDLGARTRERLTSPPKVSVGMGQMVLGS